MLFTLTCVALKTNSDTVDASTQTEYLKKGDGSYLTYRGSSEKVLTLKEYNNPIQQYRAVWVSHFAGDLSPYQNEASYKEELTEILDNMEQWGMNAMVFHIRTHNNAMYDSDLNPRARWWQNVNFDEFDPLEWLISECHSRGIEFHAWLNPYRLGGSNVIGEYPEGNPALDKSLILSNGSGEILDPSSQVVRDFIVDTCMEVIEKYDVDAIHFDDYFYISGVETDKSGDWKREQVDLFIEQLHNEMVAYNDEHGRNVQLGISPSGIYRNGGYVASPTYDENGNLISPIGSYTAGFAHYGDYLYSDTLHWINEGWIDYITPQSYWGLEHNVASYAALTRWWSWATTNKDVNLYMGMGIYMAIDSSGYWGKDVNEVNKQLLNAGMYEEIDGICVYKYASLLSSNKTVQNGVSKFKEYWGTKRVPSAVQKSYADKLPSYTVDNLNLIGDNIVWDEISNVRGYMVYKVLKSDIVDVNNIDHLVEYTQDTSIKATDTDTYDYYVASVNRANVISDLEKLETGKPSEPHTVVINRINALPTDITLEDENLVNNVVKLYNNLTEEEKALVTNYNVLQAAVDKVNTIKNLETTVDNFVNNLDKNLVDNVPVETLSNATWSYKNLSDSVAYNLTTGDIIGTFLNREITLVLTATVPGTTITYSKDVVFNMSIISSNYTKLIYRDDASCMNPGDTGVYGEESDKFIGWSRYILYVGNYALPIATGNYHEIQSLSNVDKVYWTSCAGVYVNKTGADIVLSPNNLFESPTPSYGHLIIGADGKLKSFSDATNFDSTYTLKADEILVVTRYLDRIMVGSPFASIETTFNTSTEASVVKYEVEANEEVVQTLIEIINNLPTNITLDDETTVSDALKIYNSLNDTEKAEIVNYDILASAVEKINDLKEEANKFETKQAEALAEVEKYLDLNNYSKENQNAIKRYQLIANQGINSATSVEQLNKIVSEYKENVKNIKTLSEELEVDKANTVKNIQEYLDLTNYTEKQIGVINGILATVEERVNAAKTKGELDLIESAIVAELDAVLTIEEELEELKYYYRDGLFTLYDASKYPAPSANAISDEAFRVLIEIGKATTISGVEKLVEDFEKFIANYFTLDLLATSIENAKATLASSVEEKYASDERVKTLLSNAQTKLNSILTSSEIDGIIEEFNSQYASLKVTIDSEQNEDKGGCKLFSAQVIAVTSALSLAVLLIRRRGK